jgi:hypothetical protein
VQARFTELQADDTSGGFFCCRPFDPAGGRFEPQDIGAFAGHHPLDELRKLFGTEPYGE